MKKCVLILCCLLLASCGKPAPPEPTVVTDGLFDGLAADEPIATLPPDAPTVDHGALAVSSADVAIVWDTYDRNVFAVRGTPGAGKIAEAINARFNVHIDSVHMDDFNRVISQMVLLNTKSLPDIFRLYIDGETVRERGGARPIPWDLIRRHAPRYAEYLTLSGLRGSEEDEIWYLYALEENPEMLTKFSAIRLDWLEYLGIEPRGNVTEVAYRIYFTDEAFSLNELIAMSEQMAAAGYDTRFLDSHTMYRSHYVEETMSMYSNMGAIYRNADTLMGAFGANWSNIYENGAAVMSAGSDAFKEFLTFIESMIERDLMVREREFNMSATWGFVGWWCGDIREILDPRSMVRYSNFMIPSDDPRKWLITPPEIGFNNQQGADAPSLAEINIARTYMVNAEVSDEKLIKILEIFDAVSYDPDWYLLAQYGIEGENWEWSGAPYNSYVRTTRLTDYTGVFSTGTIDGFAGKHIYGIPSEEIYRFATGIEARNMRLPPYKYNPNDIRYDEMAAEIQAIAHNYYAEVLYMGISVADTWDGYIELLRAAGLYELNAMIGGWE
jgi:hypothetical protein